MDDLTTLVRAAVAGQVDAFSRIVERFQDMAVGYAYSVLGDFHAAEDAAQEAFLDVYRNLAYLRDHAAFPAWFKAVLHNRCIRYGRERARSGQPPAKPPRTAETGPSAEESLLNEVDRESMRRALAGLGYNASIRLCAGSCLARWDENPVRYWGWADQDLGPAVPRKVDEVQARSEIRASIDAGRPVLAFGVYGPPECCVVTGYDQDGATLIGWNYHQDDGSREAAPGEALLQLHQDEPRGDDR